MRKSLLRAMENIGVLLFGIMPLLVLYQVITRYVFRAPPPWTDEIARYVMIWSTLIIGAILAAEKDHICLDFFTYKIPKPLMRIINIGLGVVLLLFFFSVFRGGLGMIETAIKVTQRSPGMGLPMWTVYTIMPFAGIVMFGNQLIDTCRDLYAMLSLRK